ncbi:hypothetical protein MRX96_036088 [Rhipicephalus microplus]
MQSPSNCREAVYPGSMLSGAAEYHAVAAHDSPMSSGALIGVYNDGQVHCRQTRCRGGAVVDRPIALSI